MFLIVLLLLSDAVYLIRAPQYANKFEDNSVKFEGSSVEDLTAFVLKN